MEELRECPCGNKAHLIFEDGTKVADPWSVACKNFDCPWVFQTFPTKEEAVKHWNTRATDPLLKEMAEALRYYSNKRIYRSTWSEYLNDHGEEHVMKDKGTRAEQVLQKYRNRHG